jgi:hypothetical protein
MRWLPFAVLYLPSYADRAHHVCCFEDAGITPE